jgi:NADH dehydrogenase FAD-containing subunit
MFAGTGIRLRVARVTAVDAGQRTVTVTDSAGADRIPYDTLLYTLGSTVGDRGVPGVAEHAFDVAGQPAALRLRRRLAELGDGRTVLVVGGNLTGIEAATEIAEARPGLRVTLATSGELGGGWAAQPGGTCGGPSTGSASPSMSTPPSRGSTRPAREPPTGPLSPPT